MRKCPNCGAQNADDNLFCTECGKPISQGNVCQYCGAPVNDGDAFCSECGNKISESTSPQTSVQTQDLNTESEPPTVYYDEEDKGKPYLKYIIGAVAVIVVLVLVKMCNFSSSNPSGSDMDSLAVDSAAVDSAAVDSAVVEPAFDPDSVAVVDSIIADETYTPYTDEAYESAEAYDSPIDGEYAKYIGKWASYITSGGRTLKCYEAVIYEDCSCDFITYTEAGNSNYLHFRKAVFTNGFVYFTDDGDITKKMTPRFRLGGNGLQTVDGVDMIRE